MHSFFKISIIRLFLVPMLLSSFMLGDFINASVAYASVAGLPEAGTMVNMSGEYSLPVLKGLKINPDSPFALEFIVDANDQASINKEEANKLISYFMAALTIDKENIWVNLSPYEQDRITDPSLAVTDLGKDLLMQDYMLKQLSASLTHPETKTGQEYWNNEYANSDLSKIWIVPGEVNVYEKGNQVFLTKMNFDVETQSEQNVSSSLVNILDEVREDVNNGENFANLRQIFHSIALAQWFKAKLQDSIFKYYINQNKVNGIELADKEIKDKIWSQYVDSFNKGAYNTIAKVKDSYSGRIQKQKYFCGGIKSSSVVLVQDSEQSAVAELTEGLKDTYSLIAELTDNDGVYWGDRELETENDSAVKVTEEIIDEFIYTPAQKSNAKYAAANLKNDIAQVIKDNQSTLYDELITFENPLLFKVLISNVNVAFDNTNTINDFYSELANLIDQYQTMAANNVDPARAEAAYLLLRNKDIVDANLPNALIVRLRDNHDETMQGLMFEQNKQLVEDITVEAKKLYSASFAMQNSPDDVAAITAEMINISLEERKVMSSGVLDFFRSEKGKALSTLNNSKSNVDDFVKALRLSFDQDEMEAKARKLLVKEMPRLPEVSRAIENYMLLEEIPEHAAYLIRTNSNQEELKQWLSVKNPEFLRMLATEYPMIHKLDPKLARNAYAEALKIVDNPDFGYAKAMNLVADEAEKVIVSKINSGKINDILINSIDVLRVELKKEHQRIINDYIFRKEVLEKINKAVPEFDLVKLGYYGVVVIVESIIQSGTTFDVNSLRDYISVDVTANIMRNHWSFESQDGTYEGVVDNSDGESLKERITETIKLGEKFDPTIPVYGDEEFNGTGMSGVTYTAVETSRTMNFDVKTFIDNYPGYVMAEDTKFQILNLSRQDIKFLSNNNLSNFLSNKYYFLLEKYDNDIIAIGNYIKDLIKQAENGQFKKGILVGSHTETVNDFKWEGGDPNDGWGGFVDSSHEEEVNDYDYEFQSDKYAKFFKDSITETLTSSAVKDEFDQLDGGIDAQGLDIKTDALSSPIEFKAFDPALFNGFGFVITHLNKVDKKTVLASL